MSMALFLIESPTTRFLGRRSMAFVCNKLKPSIHPTKTLKTLRHDGFIWFQYYSILFYHHHWAIGTFFRCINPDKLAAEIRSAYQLRPSFQLVHQQIKQKQTRSCSAPKKAITPAKPTKLHWHQHLAWHGPPNRSSPPWANRVFGKKPSPCCRQLSWTKKLRWNFDAQKLSWMVLSWILLTCPVGWCFVIICFSQPVGESSMFIDHQVKIQQRSCIELHWKLCSDCFLFHWHVEIHMEEVYMWVAWCFSAPGTARCLFWTQCCELQRCSCCMQPGRKMVPLCMLLPSDLKWRSQV